jgi:hypothetical protein
VIWAWFIRDTLRRNFFIFNFAPGLNQLVLAKNNARPRDSADQTSERSAISPLIERSASIGET